MIGYKSLPLLEKGPEVLSLVRVAHTDLQASLPFPHSSFREDHLGPSNFPIFPVIQKLGRDPEVYLTFQGAPGAFMPSS